MISNFVIGFNFRYKAPSSDAVLAFRTDADKIVLNANENLEFFASADETKDWPVKDFEYQILNAEGVIEQGNIKFLPNFAISDAGVSVKSHARQMVDAIEAVIEGRATQAQKSVRVGDKSIENFGIDELLKYLEYFKGKAAEEEGLASPNDGYLIGIRWRDL